VQPAQDDRGEGPRRRQRQLRQKSEQSGRQLQGMLAGLGRLAGDMAALRRSLPQGQAVLP
jgi:hypothetical protein